VTGGYNLATPANPTIVIGLKREGNLVMNHKIGKEIVILRNNDRL